MRKGGGFTCMKSCSTGVTHTSSGCTRLLHPDGMKKTVVHAEARFCLNSSAKCPRWMSAISRWDDDP